MKKNDIIYDELNKISDIEAAAKENKLYGNIGCSALMILENIAILPLWASNPVTAIAFEIVAAYMILPMYYINKESKEKLNNAEKEKKHLLKIMQGQIPSNENYDKKRLKRIKELEKAIETLKNKERKNNKYSIFTLFSTLLGVGVVATSITSLGLILSIAGLLAAIHSFNEGLQIINEKLSLETRIENLKRDLMYGSIFGYDPSKKSHKINNNSSTNSTKKYLKNPTYSPEQEDYANEYIEMLSRAREVEKNKVKEKTINGQK